jgi:uncharacterized protein (TIGR03084 family)
VVQIFDDLEAEQDRLESILGALDAASWANASAAPGWSVTDVVLHLAQSEELVVATIAAGGDDFTDGGWRQAGESIDAVMDRLVGAERDAPEAVFERWRQARRAAVGALRACEPGRMVRWAAAPLKPATLATTRLAEHWAHGLDVTEPLGIAFPDTTRLRHVAWLGHATLPYAFALAGEPPGDVFCELDGPDGSVWSFGDPAAESSIRGPAGEFCRVGARRLRPEDTRLVTDGPSGAAALSVLRNYAG